MKEKKFDFKLVYNYVCDCPEVNIIGEGKLCEVCGVYFEDRKKKKVERSNLNTK